MFATAVRARLCLSQPVLAERIGIYVSQLRRYEAGARASPTLDVPRRLALTLNVSADLLIFAEEERAIPEAFSHHLEGLNQLNPDERDAIRGLIEGAPPPPPGTETRQLKAALRRPEQPV